MKRSAARSGHESLRDPSLLYSVNIISPFMELMNHSNYAYVEFWKRMSVFSVKCGIYDCLRCNVRHESRGQLKSLADWFNSTKRYDGVDLSFSWATWTVTEIFCGINGRFSNEVVVTCLRSWRFRWRAPEQAVKPHREWKINKNVCYASYTNAMPFVVQTNIYDRLYIL